MRDTFLDSLHYVSASFNGLTNNLFGLAAYRIDSDSHYFKVSTQG